MELEEQIWLPDPSSIISYNSSQIWQLSASMYTKQLAMSPSKH